MPLAMHMSNELLSLPVAAVTIVLAAVAVGLCARRAGSRTSPQRLPLMGVLGAFVFAAQMINFSLPIPGASGHLGGAVLLAIVLGSEAAVVTMTAVLVVQCLLFQDGGLLALGCNIINMGIVPTVLGLGLYRLIARDGAAAWRQYLACWAACAVGVAGGAALVPLEAGISGVLRVPLGQFEALMVAVHLVIGFVEGLITFAVIAYLRQVRPELVGAPAPQAARQPGRAVVAASLLATALLLAGVISWFASEYPDGLEWVLGRSPQAVEPSGTAAAVDEFQSATALLPDYSVRPAPLGEAATGHSAEPAAKGWTSLAGVTGTLAVLGIVALASRAIRRRGGA